MKMYEMIFFDFYGTLVEEDDDCIQLVISNLIENSENRFTLITSEGTKSYKPDKRIFHYALEKCKVTPSKVLFIGDSYSSDIMGAYYTGIDSLWLNWRNSGKNRKDIINIHQMK
jgi:FMN phosphatase YigB (HAD superfamily)